MVFRTVLPSFPKATRRLLVFSGDWLPPGPGTKSRKFCLTDYGHVDASVYAGEVDAKIFGANKGGLFRTVSKDANGQYHLHAHVGSGQLTLR